MIIRITIDQIPMFWDAIKYAGASAEFVEDGFVDNYCNDLLYLLLSNRAQCFVMLDENRMLKALAITQIKVDPVRIEKTLFVRAVYAFSRPNNEQWEKGFKVITDFAKVSECKTITCWAVSNSASNLVSNLGMKERFRSFLLEV